jgi:hypothetical protein
MEYIYASKAPFATSLQPLEYDLRFSAAKDNSTTRAAVAARSLYAAIPLRSADTELQSTIELRAEATQIAAPKPDGSRRQSEKKKRFNLKRFQKEFYQGKNVFFCFSGKRTFSVAELARLRDGCKNNKMAQRATRSR